MVKQQIVLYKDFYQTKKWSEEPYEVEFKGDKARVISTEQWSKGKKSRFNKLTRVGKTGDNVHYALKANGFMTYFISTYDTLKK